MSRAFALAGINSAELRESFRLCERELRAVQSPLAAAVDLLPAQTRPHLYAIGAFAVRSDRVADEGPAAERAEAMARWCAESLNELRQGHSDHPMRRALVHTVLMWDLDTALLEELLDILTRDGSAAPRIDSEADQRRYLRAVSGTVSQLCSPMLEPTGDAARAGRLMSVLGEAFQLVDVLFDLRLDLARGRCYLPAQDLRRLGLSPDDLHSRGDRAALEDLVAIQVARARALLDQARPVTSLVHPASEPFLRACFLGLEVSLAEVARRGAAIFAGGPRLSLPTSLSVLRGAVAQEAAPTRRTWLSRLLRRRVTGRRSPLPETPESVPDHVAVIMDGNRRWAANRGEPAAAGHLGGKEAMLRFIDAAVETGLPNISMFAFSTENWSRPDGEVDELMSLLLDAVQSQTEQLHQQGIRLRWCGRRDRVSPELRTRMEDAERRTARNTKLTLTLCVDYGGRAEMVTAARALAADVESGLLRAGEIDEADLARQFYLPDLPDVDLLIRTSGEQRISNFLPWHTAYAEIVFTPVLWPDFTREHLLEAIREYSGRRRRFGGSELHTATP
ncbi:polyprenyl diphosphate synthase [Allokutzneria oryzae]|uniref:Isoprenyl transferase n=1 Tax=Allokutzneria oryzae TaxID=1378989 RepID=A0ABV5ZV08_9PSEU